MADVHSKETRSYNMSRIRSKNTKPELLVRRFLFSRGYRYKLHDKKLSGKPDIVLPKYKTVLFVHGCFWHGHEGCKYYVVPKTRTDWWLTKIQSNRKKDNEAEHVLNSNGWNIIKVWECELKNKLLDKTLKEIIEKLHLNIS